MHAVFTVYGRTVTPDGTAQLHGPGTIVGVLSAGLFIWVLVSSGSAWIMGACRMQAAACLDGGGPRSLGRISPHSGVPVAICLFSGLVLHRLVGDRRVDGVGIARRVLSTLAWIRYLRSGSRFASRLRKVPIRLREYGCCPDRGLARALHGLSTSLVTTGHSSSARTDLDGWLSPNPSRFATSPGWQRL
jgi:hypothetical protein